MRLIDADKLPYIKAPIAPILVGDEVVWCNIVYKLHIDNAPTVDAVPVVRCRACIHWSDGGVDEAGRKLYPYCHLNDDQRKSNDYCSYGKRKGGDK